MEAPKFRAWIKTEKRMFFSDDILAIDYENEEIVTQQVYFENGLPDDRDIYCYNPDEIELMQSTDMVDRNGNIIFEGDRIKTLMGTIINVDRIKRSITVEGVELGSDCRALVSKHKDGTGTITLVFDGKII